MNLLLDPDLWSSVWGTPVTPAASWNGTAYVHDSPPGNESNLDLYGVDNMSQPDTLRAIVLFTQGENPTANISLRDYTTDDLIDGPFVLTRDVPLEVELDLPNEGTRVAVVVTGGGYDCRYVITPLADEPALVANNDAAATPFNTPIDVNVLANDTLDGVAPVDPSEVDLTVLSQPANGTAVANSDGTVTYTPNPGFYGTDTFVYNIELTGGGA